MPDAWLAKLGADPRPWLFDPERPAVRHLALRLLEVRPPDDPEVVKARVAAKTLRAFAAIPMDRRSAVDAPGAPSPWVTLRAFRVLRAALG